MQTMKKAGRCCLAAWILTGAAVLAEPERQDAPIGNRPIETYRADLLDRAYDVASAMPLKPHIKDRSRAQEKVLQAALELDQPASALRYAEGIANWRRGKGFADYACYSVEHGITNGIPLLLIKAESIAGTATQDWRRDAVLHRIAQVNRLLEQKSTAPSGADTGSFEERFAQVDTVVLKGGLDDAKGVVDTCLRLYDEYYSREEARDRIRNKIEQSWGSMPVLLRLESLKKMVRTALANGDQAAALQMVEQGVDMMKGNTWPAEYSIPLAAEFAALRFRAGDAERARAELEQALTSFGERRSGIVDIDRAETLTALAEAAVVMGDQPRAAALYTDALDAAVVNANSRPRAEDISMICVSMALRGFEPDEALCAKLDALRRSLGAPW